MGCRATFARRSHRLRTATRPCGRGGNGVELECAEEQRAEPMQHRPGARSEGGQIGFVGTRQAFGFLDIARKLVPADRSGDRFVEVRSAIPRLDQRHAGRNRPGADVAGQPGTCEDLRKAAVAEKRQRRQLRTLVTTRRIGISREMPRAASGPERQLSGVR